MIKFDKNKIHDNISGIVIGIILAFIGFHINSFLQNKYKEKELTSAKPEIKIILQELPDDVLSFEITSLNLSGSNIDKLFLKFDIPGVYSNHELHYKDKIEKYKLLNHFATGTNNITTSETIKIEIESFYPTGSMQLYIHYKPVKVISQTLKKMRHYFTPTLDLHDYLPYYFTWDFDGNSRTEKGVVDLSYLDFIIKDNNNLIENTSFTKWPLNDYLKNNPDHPISKYILGLDDDKLLHNLKVAYLNNPFSNDTLYVEQDSILIKSTYKGLFRDDDSIRLREYKRRNWY